MQNGDTVYYAVGVYSQTSAGSSTNGIVAFDEPWKNVVATFYHELNEARTDPDVEDAIKAGNGGERFLGWMSTQGEECGDFPVFEDPSLSKVFVEVPLADGSGTVPVQLQYSNAVHGPEGPIASPHQAARRPSSTPLPSRGVGPSAQGQPGSPVRAVRVTTVVEVPLDGSQMAVGPNAGGDVSGIRERSAASVSGRKNIEAHLTTGGPISAALITGDDPNGTDFTGDPTDQTATIQTDEFGQLVWALDLDTQTPFTSWQLSLTEKGKTEGQPDASDTTDSSGHAVDSSGQNPGGIKQF